MSKTDRKCLLEASDVSLIQGNSTLLENISLRIYQGEITTIIGPNGAGKTTLLNILLGLSLPSHGKIERASELRIGYMPQRLQLNPQLPLSVKRFLYLARASVRDGQFLDVDEALSRTGVCHLKDHAMQTLSGGETQRVLLARALLRRPQLLVLDEPVQGVDINGQDLLYQLIKSLRDEFQCAVLMVSHDLHLVMAATDHVICLNQHICCHGHPESVSNHPAYLQLFGPAAANLATYTHHHDHAHDLDGEVIESAHHHQCGHNH